jgi:hypothetical protein
LPTAFNAVKSTIGDFEEAINLRGTTSFSLIKTPFAYKQTKAKCEIPLHKYTLFQKFVNRFLPPPKKLQFLKNFRDYCRQYNISLSI